MKDNLDSKEESTIKSYEVLPLPMLWYYSLGTNDDDDDHK